MDDDSIRGLRADLAAIYGQLTAMQTSAYWFRAVVEWLGLIYVVLLGLILWRVW